MFVVLIACSKDEIDDLKFYSGVLVVKGICMNYVIQVLDDDFPRDLLETNWTNEFSEQEFQNVFALGSVCDFPENIDQGDAFKFLIDDNKENLCAVCLAYSPVPQKRVSITVVEN